VLGGVGEGGGAGVEDVEDVGDGGDEEFGAAADVDSAGGIGDVGPPRRGFGGFFAADVGCQDKAEAGEGVAAIVVLGAGFNGDGVQAGGDVGDTDGGAGFVALLAARTAGAVGLDPAVAEEGLVGEFAGGGGLG
jgi:hypothetical protein